MDHGLDGLLNWSLTIRPLAEIDVDIVGSQALQTFLASLRDIFWIANHPAHAVLVIATKLGHQGDIGLIQVS